MNITITSGGSRRRPRALLLTAVAVASALTLAACSGGSSDSSSTSEGPGEASAVVTDAMGPVTEIDAPADSFTPPTGKHILIMPCSSAGQGCVDEAEEEKRVAESLGWTVDVVDGKFDPTVYNQTIKNAVASGVDGIIAISADPNLYGDAMTSVVAKRVPFVLTQQTPGANDVEGIDTYIAPDPLVGGEDVAEWLMADSAGKAHVLLLDVPGVPNVQQRTAAIAAKLKSDCADCVVYSSDITTATLGTSLAPLVTTQLQQHPDIDYVWGSDDATASFIQQGIQLAGKSGSVKLLSMTGLPQQMSQIKTGQVALELASPTPYSAWAAVDSLARLMADQSVSKFQVVPQRIWTEANIDDAPEEIFTRGWDIEFDYRDAYHTLWGTK
ncbi:sugar ABC transporter substrate-binding protein [Microbacterium sp. MAHUQ-60]|uniref:sugar ABC transporter substrate-binding protein n=1 Tax=unclassified Microbacterium TaxID=2609290 RepID=UPI00360751B4